jgi:hypothetical protein
MKRSSFCNFVLWGLLWAWVGGWWAEPPAACAASEDTFDVLQIGPHTYRKVTVTTKSTNYVFILHAEGMTNLKVSELSPELRQKLGYQQSAPAAATNTAALWAKQTLAKLDQPQLLSVGEKVRQAWRSSPLAARVQLPPLTPQVIGIFCGVMFALYLFHCYCCALICRKAGKPGGALVWLPLFQIFPLLRAAGMSGWWFLAFFVPVLNLVAAIIWCFKIADARGKSALIGLFLLLPVLSFLAFLYLAFSNGGEPEQKQQRVQIMTLEAA